MLKHSKDSERKMDQGNENNSKLLAVGKSGKKRDSNQATTVKSAQSPRFDTDEYENKSLRKNVWWSWFWIFIFGINLIGFMVLKLYPEWIVTVTQNVTTEVGRFFYSVVVFNLVFIFKGSFTALILFLFSYNRMAFYFQAIELSDTRGIMNSIYYSKYDSPKYDVRSGFAFQSITLQNIIRNIGEYKVGFLLLLLSLLALLTMLGFTGYYLYMVLTMVVPLSISDVFLMFFCIYEAIYVLRYLFNSLKLQLI